MNQKKFFFRLLSTLVFAMLLSHSSTILAQDFITKWTFSSPTTEIKFNAVTAGSSVYYTWTTTPSGNNGSGTFNSASGQAVTLTGLNIAGGDIVTLRMVPTHLRRFWISNGPQRSNLIEVSQWGAVPWSSMTSAFFGCENLTITAIDVPNLTTVTDMSFMFLEATSLNQPIGNWNTSNVTNMQSMFAGATSFNQPIGNWNTANVTSMQSMFGSATSFNQPIGNWNTANVTSMQSMFGNATSFNQPIGNWNTANVTNMHGMFGSAMSFNQPIGNWNTANVTDMSQLFGGAMSFNQPMGNWNTANVTDMSAMFAGAKSFNQPIGNWITNKVTDMSGMFLYAWAFNQPIGSWNTVNVTDMSYMFHNALSFNQIIGGWNTAKVTDMSYMFLDATSFNRIIGGWALGAIISPGLSEMLSNSGMDCGNYTSTLIGWRAKNPLVMGLKLGATGRRYGTNAVLARNALRFNQGWDILGDSPSGSPCYASIPDDGCCNQDLTAPSPTWGVFTESDNEQYEGENGTVTKALGNLGSSHQNFQVYPNPLSPSTILHVVVTGVELSPEATLRIRDLQGRVVHQQTLSTQTDLQLSLLVAGVYLLEATDGKSVWRERVVLVE